MREVHTLNKEVHAELQELKKEVDTMVQSTNTWYKIYNKLNDKFKEVGDLYNWSKIVEEDLDRVLEAKAKRTAP